MRRLSTALDRLAVGLAATFMMIVANLMQFALGVLAPYLIADLPITVTTIGFLASIYYLVAGVSSLLLGGLIGRVGPRRSAMALAGITASGFVVSAISSHPAVVAGGVILCGLAAAISNPATNMALSAISRWRGPLMGVKQSGVAFGAVVAGLLLAPVADIWNWRVAFFVCAALAATLLVVVRVVPDNAPRAEGYELSYPPGKAPVLPLCFYAFFMGAGFANTTAYLVIFADRKAALSHDHTGLLLATVGICAVIARVIFSTLADMLVHSLRGVTGLLSGMAALAVVATASVTVSPIIGSSVLWLGATLLGISGAAWNGVVMLAVTRWEPIPRVAQVSGWVQAGFFAGLCVGPAVYAALLAASGYYTLGWAWAALCYAAAIVVSLVTNRRLASDPSN